MVNKWMMFMVGSLLVLAGCGKESPIVPYAVLQPDMAPLKAAFNADVTKVRVVMLVAPT